MSPALNGSSTLEHFERSTTIEICNRIMFNFYPGLPHTLDKAHSQSVPPHKRERIKPYKVLISAYHPAGLLSYSSVRIMVVLLHGGYCYIASLSNCSSHDQNEVGMAKKERFSDLQNCAGRGSSLIMRFECASFLLPLYQALNFVLNFTACFTL